MTGRQGNQAHLQCIHSCKHTAKSQSLHRGVGPVRSITDDFGWEEAADVDGVEGDSVEAADGDRDGDK